MANKSGILKQTATGNGGYRIYYEYTQSIENNTTTITAYFQILKNAGTSYNQTATKTISIGGTQVHSSTGFETRNLSTGVWTSIASGSRTIEHNQDGTCNPVSIAIYCATGTGGYGTINASDNIVPETIPRASKINSITCETGTGTAQDYFDIEKHFNINITKYYDAFYQKLSLRYDLTDGEYVSLEITSGDIINEFDISLIDAEYATIFNTSNYGKFKFELKTYSDNTYTTLIGTETYETYLGLYNINPTFDNITVAPYQNPTSIGNNVLVKTQKLQVTIPTATALKGGSITSYTIKCGEQTKTVSQSGTYVFENITTNIVTATANDKRGNSTLKSAVYLNYIEYAKPTITKATIDRKENGISKKVLLDLEGTFTDKTIGNATNAATYKVAYSEYGKDEYTEIGTLTATTENNNITFEGEISGDLSAEGFTLTKSFDIKVTLYDIIDQDIEIIFLANGKPAMAIHQNGIAIGDQYDETLGGELQITGTAYYNGQELGTGGGGGGDTLPVGAIINYEGTEVPDGYVEVSNPDYSTNESWTGQRWINNKKIYRKVIVTNTTTSTTSYSHSISSLNIENVIKLYSIANSPTPFDKEPYEQDYYVNSSDTMRTFINRSKILNINIGGSYPQRPGVVYTILEYTKTTD